MKITTVNLLEFELELQYWVDYYTYRVGQQEVKVINLNSDGDHKA